jgi:bifunctional non-homologous end joining protein LigD
VPRKISTRPPTVAPPAAAGEEPLAAYRAKRDPGVTPEPFGGGAPRPRLFCVQEHAARRRHFDLRLEMDGVLRSWAVPQGFSADPATKRLAVQTEDHPVEYADFEGVIPKGEYGAGPMILWDRGLWVPLLDPAESMPEGKLLFELRGFKLRGKWTLVKIKGPRDNPNTVEWLLIKERGDGWVRRGEDAEAFPPHSVLSGLTVEELRSGVDRAAGVVAELPALRAPRRALDPRELDLMLARYRESAFDDDEWVFELKYDGYRTLAARTPAGPLLLSRAGNELTSRFPEVARAVAALPGQGLVVDGEVVVLDADGRPSFQGLQKRAQLSRRGDIERGAVERPATLYLFDLLAVGGHDLRPLPLVERKRLLAGLVPPLGTIRFADHVAGTGSALFEEVRRRGLEGIMAKRAASAYRGGRSDDWLKIRADKEGELWVVGYTLQDPRGSRVGSLDVAGLREGVPTYAGRVGSGLTDEHQDLLARRLTKLRTDDWPLSGPAPAVKGSQWVRPRLRCTVRYKEWTEVGQLRHPVLLDLAEEEPPAALTAPASAAAAAAGPDAAPDLRLSRLDKVFWPEEGYTKGDLIAYYRTVSPLLLPYLRDRPVVLDRYPDGITGKSFYQKNSPDFLASWIATIPVWSEGDQREIRYATCPDEESLLQLVNLGTIPFHLWASRAPHLDRPDWCILDLDPKGAPFAHVVELALGLRDLCEQAGLPSFVKTSGSSGLHVLLPLGAQLGFEQSRMLAEVLARLLVARFPKLATVTRAIGARGGKVYVDYLQNRVGQLLAAPWCVRPLPGAPVSTPLDWSEVGPQLDPRAFHLRSVPQRVERRPQDPLRPVLEETADVARALARLSAASS